jgi:hypothetical protein
MEWQFLGGRHEKMKATNIGRRDIFFGSAAKPVMRAQVVRMVRVVRVVRG